MKVYCIFYTDYDNSCLVYLYLNEENVKKKVGQLNLNEETDNYHYRAMSIADFDECASKIGNEGFKQGYLHAVRSHIKLLEE